MESLSLEAGVLTEVMSRSHQPIVFETDRIPTARIEGVLALGGCGALPEG
jgi:hypothetical protein